MTRAIWKQVLKITDLQRVAMPRGSKLLSVAKQGCDLCLWYSVETDMPDEERVIEIIGTGNPIEAGKRDFIGTVVLDPFVWHVFERWL